MRKFSFLSFFSIASLIALTAVACGGESKLGEECDEVGKTEDVCESGGICGKRSDGALACLKLCTDDAQCAATEECNGVEGTNQKGCRLKATSGGGATDADGGKK